MTATVGRVHAPELQGAGGWINTTEPLSLAALHGRVVVLDFWTFCCINCLRVIEELRPIERRFGDRVVVIGVHSPKFPHESDHGAVLRAVQRHRIEHPVLDDPALETWQRYGVRAWPTLVVIDQQGYVAAVAPGEGNGAALTELIAKLLEGGVAVDGPAYALPEPDAGRQLSFPGKVAVEPGSGRLAIADTGNDRVLLTDPAGSVIRAYDGFHQPQGVRFDGERLVVCDTVAGTLVAVDLESAAQTVLAEGMHSPWDVVLLADRSLLVAEAGRHRLLSVPAEGGQFSVVAGTGAEGLRDGPALQAHLAQPSGLTRLDDGGVAFADSEVSALRVLRDGSVETLVGSGLFNWGAGDGDRSAARLQHPLGVVALSDGGIAVADTFNSRLRVWRDGMLHTLVVDTRLDEPGGLDVTAGGQLVVADTNNHRVVVVERHSGSVRELQVGDALAPPLAGEHGTTLWLRASVDLDGEALDPSHGPPVRVHVSADPESLLAAGPRSWALSALPAELEVPLGVAGTGSLSVDVIAATCHDDVCTVRRSTLTHPLRVS